jgi:hypothetical protein
MPVADIVVGVDMSDTGIPGVDAVFAAIPGIVQTSRAGPGRPAPPCAGVAISRLRVMFVIV